MCLRGLGRLRVLFRQPLSHFPFDVIILAVAGQVFNSVMNNQIINSPGPLALDDDEFLPTMAEIALNVADLKDR